MRVTVLVVAALLVAGCSADKGNDAPLTPTSSPTDTATQQDGNATPPALDAVPSLQLSDCANLGGVFPVPMDAARATLPAGFEPVASPNDPQGGATLYVLFLQCTGSQVDGNETGPTNVAYAELAVEPTTEFQLDRVGDYTVPLAIGATSDPVGKRLAEWMLGQAGPSTISDVTNGSPGPVRASMTVAGVTLGITGQAVPNAGATIADGDFALIGVQDGAVKSVVRGHSQGGSAMQAGATMDSDGLPLLEQARPATAGFRVTGFTLTFTLDQQVA